MSILSFSTVTSVNVIACSSKTNPTPTNKVSQFADLGQGNMSLFLAFDKQGNLYSSTEGSNKIFKIRLTNN